MVITDKNKIYIGGLPFQVKYEDKYLGSQGYSVRSNNGKLIITTKEAYPKARRDKYIIQTAGIQMLGVAGVNQDMIKKYGEAFGNALYEFLLNNSIRWVTQAEDIPDDVIIGSLAYAVVMSREQDALLEDGDANGQIYYNDLEIGIRTDVPPAYQNATLCHEIIHGILYESRFPGDHNDESVVLPLGSLFYNFLRDNPILSKDYPQYPQNDVDKMTEQHPKCRCSATTYTPQSDGKGMDDVGSISQEAAREIIDIWKPKNPNDVVEALSIAGHKITDDAARAMFELCKENVAAHGGEVRERPPVVPYKDVTPDDVAEVPKGFYDVFPECIPMDPALIKEDPTHTIELIGTEINESQKEPQESIEGTVNMVSIAGTMPVVDKYPKVKGVPGTVADDATQAEATARNKLQNILFRFLMSDEMEDVTEEIMAIFKGGKL